MKKIITILTLIVISTIFIVGCSNSKNEDKDVLYIENCSENIFGMGKKYYINNLKKGYYEVEFTAKEYEYGVLKEEHLLYKSVIDYNKNYTKLKLGIVDGVETEYSLNAIINDLEYECENVEFLKDSFDIGMAISVLEEDKSFNLDDELAIAVYSVGGENRITEGISIDEDFIIGNGNIKDLVIYIKLHKINK